MCLRVWLIMIMMPVTIRIFLGTCFMIKFDRLILTHLSIRHPFRSRPVQSLARKGHDAMKQFFPRTYFA